MWVLNVSQSLLQKIIFKIIATSMKPANCIVSVFSDQRVCVTQSEHCPLLANTYSANRPHTLCFPGTALFTYNKPMKILIFQGNTKCEID